MSAMPEEIVFDAYTEEQAGTTSLHEASADDEFVDDLTAKQKELIERKLEEYRVLAEEREHRRIQDRTERLLGHPRSFVGVQLLQAVIEA